jgi:methyl-accepting chemotaxis protein
MLHLAKGDLTIEIPAAAGANEVGEITGAVAIFRRNAVETAALRQH